MSAIRNRATKDRKQRVKLRAKLQAQGMSEAMIEYTLDRRRHDDLVKRVGEDQARIVRRVQARNSPDDAGFKPSFGDPLLKGAGRADGVTAKVVKRSNTITEFQYDQIVGLGDSNV